MTELKNVSLREESITFSDKDILLHKQNIFLFPAIGIKPGALYMVEKPCAPSSFKKNILKCLHYK